jgi:hypothetical protein
MHAVHTNAMPDPQDPAVNPAQVAAWLARARSGRTSVPTPATHWNLWLGLRFLLRLRAEEDLDRAWARLVLAVDEHMARHQRLAEVPLGEVAQESMLFRVGLLRRLGAVPGDELLDPAVVLDWARAALTEPLEETLALAARCRRRMGTTAPARTPSGPWSATCAGCAGSSSACRSSRPWPPPSPSSWTRSCGPGSSTVTSCPDGPHPGPSHPGRSTRNA